MIIKIENKFIQNHLKIPRKAIKLLYYSFKKNNYFHTCFFSIFQIIRLLNFNSKKPIF